MLVRSPMLTNSESSVMFSGSRPERRIAGCGSAGSRGVAPSTTSAMRGDVVRRGAAAAADEVDQSRAGELAEHRGHLVRRLVVLAERVGQAGVGVAGDEAVGHPGELREVGADLGGAQRAVQADGQRAGVPHRVPERLGDLAGQRAPGRVGDRARDDHRPAAPALLEEGLEREDRGLGVERVEDRLDEQQVGPAVDQARGLFGVRLDQLLEADVAEARVVDVRARSTRCGWSGPVPRPRTAAATGRPR